MMFQAFNGRTKRWVKYNVTRKGNQEISTITDVKQRDPTKPFKGIKIK